MVIQKKHVVMRRAGQKGQPKMKIKEIAKPLDASVHEKVHGSKLKTVG
jgi:hypothetical protein